MKSIKILLPLIALLFGYISVSGQSSHILWYDEPAELFEQSLVLGNGTMGASVFGGVSADKIYLNDATLWSGEPVDPYMNPDAHLYIPLIREALQNEDYKKADSLNRFIQGSFSQSFAPMGTVYFDFAHADSASEYYRELNIDEAVSKVNYSIGDVDYTREYFISHPDQMMHIKLESNKEASLNFGIGFGSQLIFETSVAGNMLTINGYAPYHAEPSYRGDMPDAVMFDASRGTRFTVLIKIQDTDGKIISTDSTIGIAGGTKANIMLTSATSFSGYDKDPAREGLDNNALAIEKMEAIAEKSYNELIQAHLDDYQSFFKRVNVDLGASSAPNLPTDERLKRYASGAEDKNLEILYFQFGRYLLISSSRTMNVPANLQGIWNPYLRPPWSSNYTMNINVEENYWMAETSNLSEMHQPLLGFIRNLSKTGAITAKTFYGVEQGWTAAHNSDIWAMSNPVGDFGKGHPVWANWNMSGAWLSTHLWEHYTFSGSISFLSDTAYPIMKGAAEFCLGWLVEDKKGNLITSPSTSPENLYITPAGYTGATLYGATADLAMIRELFQQTIEASEILKIDTEFRDELSVALSKLYPYQIGEAGNLQEWYYDWQDQDPQHRHQSHLFGLYPGHHITAQGTPELAAACRKTLEIKGDESTGWSKGWRINLWARLLDGNHAYKMYRELLSYIDPSGKETQYTKGGGTYPNLLDAHPPFQIDGNFGGSAGFIEMLVQSKPGEIHLLPALPDAWPSGKVNGICARGGFEISMEWKDNRPNVVKILSKNGRKTNIIFDGDTTEVDIGKGQDLLIFYD